MPFLLISEFLNGEMISLAFYRTKEIVRGPFKTTSLITVVSRSAAAFGRSLVQMNQVKVRSWNRQSEANHLAIPHRSHSAVPIYGDGPTNATINKGWRASGRGEIEGIYSYLHLLLR